MTKKTIQRHKGITTERVRGARGVQEATRRLAEDNYMPLFPGGRVKGDLPGGWDDYIHASVSGTAVGQGSDATAHGTGVFFASSGMEMMIGTEDCGTEGRGWMAWGDNNDIPNRVSLLTGLLPYTAAGWKFNTDLASALGPRPMFRYARYVGGNVSEVCVPYESAGALISGWLRDARRELVNATASQPAFGHPSGTAQALLCEDIQKEIDEYTKQYDTWRETNAQLQEFLAHNNLNDTFIQLFADQTMLGMCFPEILLNANETDADGKVVSAELWKPRAVGIDYRSAHTCRLERMDDTGRINYVYVSNRWLDQTVITQDNLIPDMSAIPALSRRTPVDDMRRAVRQSRLSKKKASERPTRFILPTAYPTPGRPYYPVPAWHSIFAGCIYELASTIMSDRMTRRKNSNIIGRIVYINNEYLRSMYNQRNADSDEKKKAVRDEMFRDINIWLSNRDNSGQSLFAFTFRSPDGKEYESFKIVEIESASKNTAEANQKELQEVSSIIFFSQNLDSRLVGNTPGTEAASGGTDLRERFLLKSVQMTPTQHLVLYPLEVISRFNAWDTHLEWEIGRAVLTTLDNSKTGVSEE